MHFVFILFVPIFGDASVDIYSGSCGIYYTKAFEQNVLAKLMINYIYCFCVALNPSIHVLGINNNIIINVLT